MTCARTRGLIGDHPRLCGAENIGIASTHLSIRTSFVGSMELFLDPVLDDPRLGTPAGGAPLRGVRLNNAAIVDQLKEMRREKMGGSSVVAGEMRKEGERGRRCGRMVT